MKDLIERLRQWFGADERNRKAANEAADLLERIYSQPVELPEADLHGGITVTRQGKYKSTEDGYTADQLTQAVQEATARALEAAAMECEAQIELWSHEKSKYALEDCAEEIRNLIGGVK